jgi:predicted metal-dependent phosphoesterase TrpH
MGTADLHLHTSHSDGVASLARMLEHIERNTRLDVIAITDHEDLRPSLEARELAARRGYRFEVVPGMEVTTRDGHLIVLFVETPVRSLESLEHTIAEVRERGGLCVVPHPLARWVPSVGLQAFTRVLSRPDPYEHFDGIELSRSNFVAAQTEARARMLNERYALAEIGSSDAHFLPVVGTSYTSFPGHTAQDLRQAMLDRATHAHAERAIRLREIGPRNLLRQQIKGSIVLPLRRARLRMGQMRTLRAAEAGAQG